MASGRKFLKQVIEMYRDLHCLWKRTDPDYNNKSKRNAAIDQLLELFKQKDPNANRDSVQKKINSLRGSFRKELNKVRVSEQSATSPDEIHVPKLWYYDLMIFLKDQEVPYHSKRTYSVSKEGTYDDIGYEEFESDTPASLSRESTPVPSEGTFKRTRSKTLQVLHKIASDNGQPPQSAAVQMSYRQHEAFGQHIAEKLRSLLQEQLPICQKLINDAIFYAEIGALNLSSRIVSITPKELPNSS